MKAATISNNMIRMENTMANKSKVPTELGLFGLILSAAYLPPVVTAILMLLWVVTENK